MKFLSEAEKTWITGIKDTYLSAIYTPVSLPGRPW